MFHVLALLFHHPCGLELQKHFIYLCKTLLVKPKNADHAHTDKHRKKRAAPVLHTSAVLHSEGRGEERRSRKWAERRERRESKLYYQLNRLTYKHLTYKIITN